MIPSRIDARFDRILERPPPAVSSYSPSHVPRPDRTPRGRGCRPDERPSGSSTTCVIADDHPAIAEAVADILERRSRSSAARERDRRSRADRGAPAGARAARPAHPGLAGIEIARRVGPPRPEAGSSTPGSATGRSCGRWISAPGLRAQGGAARRGRACGQLLRRAGTYVDPVLARVLSSSSGDRAARS